MEEMKKYTINEKLNALPKETAVAKRELRKLLGIGHNRMNEIIGAVMGTNKNANARQLGIMAKYFKCSLRELYTDDYYQSLPTLTSIKQAVEAAA